MAAPEMEIQYNAVLCDNETDNGIRLISADDVRITDSVCDPASTVLQ